MTYYIYVVEHKEKKKYCLWYEDYYNDKLMIDKQKVLTFESLIDILEYGEINCLNLINNNDFLKIEDSILNSYRYYLTVWNLAVDISNSVYSNIWIKSKTDKINKIYSKLIWGSNLRSLTPEGSKLFPFFLERKKIY